MEGKDVLTVDDYGAIRRAHRDGESIRQIARDYGHSRNTIRKIHSHSEPNPEPATRSRSAPVLGTYQAFIDQTLQEDQDAPPKQRHTAMQLFRRPRDEQGYAGCYGQVQRCLLSKRSK
jgi:transposase